MSRFSEFLVADEFRSLRRLYFGAWASVFGSFALLLLLTVLLKYRFGAFQWVLSAERPAAPFAQYLFQKTE
jgi:hypothetical protein